MQKKQQWIEKWQQYKHDPIAFLIWLVIHIATVITFFILLYLLAFILVKGIRNLDLSMFSLNYTSENVSLLPALINTFIMTVISLLIAVPIGIISAIYLMEYCSKESFFIRLIDLVSETLSGIPSIVYGLFGYLFFVTTLGWGYSLIAGAATLAIIILPLIIRTTSEALKTVPDLYREGSYGLGIGKLRTIVKIVLPSAMPGVLSGVILSVGRIVGETAALIYTSGTVAQIATNVKDSGRTLAVHMYNLSSEGLHMDKAYGTAVVLLVLVLAINQVSKIVARKFTKGDIS